MTHLPPGHRAFNFELDVRQIRDGWNEIVVFNNAGFYSLITTGRIASAQDRCEQSIRLICVEIGLVAGAKAE
jgi:hypothetical protein